MGRERNVVIALLGGHWAGQWVQYVIVTISIVDDKAHVIYLV